jgi:hypothetical protein
MLRGLKNWAARQIEKRVRAEWDEYRGQPEVRTRLFKRGAREAGTHVSRSFIEINFHKGAPDGDRRR